jgi:hypothetical protein
LPALVVALAAFNDSALLVVSAARVVATLVRPGRGVSMIFRKELRNGLIVTELEPRVDRARGRRCLRVCHRPL